MKEKWQNQHDTEDAPWDYYEFDVDFKEELLLLSKVLGKNKTVIDLGCGNGSQAHYIEKMGYDVTAADIVNVLKYDVKNFVINDALDSKLTKTYDIIIDRGLVHNLFHLENRNKYFEMIGNITHEKSYILLKVMSPYETRFHPLTHTGPYRFTEGQLVKFFSGFNFYLLKLKDTFFYSNIQPYLRGYFCVYKKEEYK